MNKTIGLTLGKFAPFHRGHQFLIETALRETDHTIVVIYDAPETTPIPLDVRADWIRTLYPRAEVIEGWKGPADMGDTPEIEKIQEDYILGLLGGRQVTHFYSSEFYSVHMSRALKAINREVDRNRSAIPVSATLIRTNPYLYRNFLAPVVYRDLITHVVFLGAPSTGKTTLAEAMAGEYNTCWMPEYGRTYWEEHQVERRLTPDQLVEIGIGQLAEEEKKLLEANHYLFTDTNALTTAQFSLYYHSLVPEALVRMAELAEQRYDLVFLCDTDIPYADTWDRSGEVNRLWFQQQIISDLKNRKIPYILLQGDLNARILKVREILEHFVPYQDQRSPRFNR